MTIEIPSSTSVLVKIQKDLENSSETLLKECASAISKMGFEKFVRVDIPALTSPEIICHVKSVLENKGWRVEEERMSAPSYSYFFIISIPKVPSQPQLRDL